MSQTDAARAVGLSKSYVSDIEGGKKKVTLDVLEKYSEAFDIPVSALMLFSERTINSTAEDKTRSYVTRKAVKILDWIETVTETECGRDKNDR